jgi:calcineurin-like phosphoesterase family protein
MAGRIQEFLYRVFIARRVAVRTGPDQWEARDGTRVWFISDTHFGHRRVFSWCRQRFFHDVTHMNHHMVANWNHRVGRYDRVFCLGDFGDRTFLGRLAGRTTFVRGNHDRTGWDTHARVTFRDMRFLVIHDPDDPLAATLNPDGEWIIHGHTHGNSPFIDAVRRRVNVSVDVTGFSPVSMEELYLAVMDSRENKAGRHHR